MGLTCDMRLGRLPPTDGGGGLLLSLRRTVTHPPHLYSLSRLCAAQSSLHSARILATARVGSGLAIQQLSL